MKRWVYAFSGMLLAASALAHAAEPAANFDAAMQPFLKTYCLRCHDAQTQEGKFRLDTLARDFTDQAAAEHWAEVLFRINSGEMPPEDEPQPSAEELGRIAAWLAQQLKQGEAARMARRGPVAHYRLSREEYGHTVYDLLGVYFDVNLPGRFNEDPRWHGYDRIGSLLSLSPSHVDRYFSAAEMIVSQAVPDQPAASQKSRRAADPGDGKWKEQGLPGPPRWLLWPGSELPVMHAGVSGLYRVKIQLSGLPSFKGRPPHLSLWHQGRKRAVAGWDIQTPEDQPTTIEFEGLLPEGGFTLINESPGMLSDGHTLSHTRGSFVNTRVSRVSNPTGYKLFDEEGRPIFPMLIVDWFEVEGPILTDADQHKREGLYPATEGDLALAEQGLRRFATRAWRRPASEAEIKRYLQILQSELAAGENFRSAYRAALVGILTSKNFYYLEEGSAAERRTTVNDWELAARLSYFLWNSMPDDELFAAAQAGNLRQPEVLRAQLARMLGDAKIERFTDAFPRQWLQLHRIGVFPPDAALYPDYDKWLETSMALEATGYFHEVFAQNLSLREFLVSDWTMLNPRLALHYGLPLSAQPALQRVALSPEAQRGGLLTQAGILSLTSDGVRHRPVHRGVWISEAIFGRTPPPPPPNVEPLAPTPSDQPKATIRMQIEAHATHATCASCHRTIDPLGFAFENFDALGRLRTQEQVAGGQGADPPVDPAGKLPDGRPFQNAAEFKQLLAQDLDRFAAAFVEQLATYALRRAMTLDDAAQIQAIAAASKKDDYKLRVVIENLVLSELFQRK